MYYLPFKNWSQRYENRFFTIKVESESKKLTEPPYEKGFGKKSHPAWYYDIEVFVGSSEPYIVTRRYSEFLWLDEEIRKNPPTGAQQKNLLKPPPGTYFCQPQSAPFREDRQRELGAFLYDCLQRPGYAQHPAMQQFLMLDTIELTEVKPEIEAVETAVVADVGTDLAEASEDVVEAVETEKEAPTEPETVTEAPTEPEIVTEAPPEPEIVKETEEAETETETAQAETETEIAEAKIEMEPAKAETETEITKVETVMETAKAKEDTETTAAEAEAEAAPDIKNLVDF